MCRDIADEYSAKRSSEETSVLQKPDEARREAWDTKGQAQLSTNIWSALCDAFQCAVDRDGFS